MGVPLEPRTMLPVDISSESNSFAERVYRYKFSIMACVRWEEDDLLEWVEYHRQIGFDHIYIYSNDDDPAPTARLLMPYLCGDDPYVTFRHYPKRNPAIPQQQDIYFHFFKHFLHETEWFSLIDIDEFYVFKNINCVHTFMAEYETRYDVVYFNWLIYGHVGKITRDRESILLSHTFRAPNIDMHTKMLTRSSTIDWEDVQRRYKRGAKAFWHFLSDYEMPNLRTANVIHDNMDGYVEDFPVVAIRYVQSLGVSSSIIEKAYLAHFQFKSEHDFMRRVLRGGSNTVPLWKKTYEDGSYKQRLATANKVWDIYLAQYWIGRLCRGNDFVTERLVALPLAANVALRKPTTQSSVRPPEQGDPVASSSQGRANSGVRTGSYGFCTLEEDRPWWCVDLLQEFQLLEIHIYNRTDSVLHSAHARHLLVETSANYNEWTTLFQLDGTVVFGGMGSTPLVAKMKARSVARFIRVTSWRPAILHLDEIEVYGIPWVSG